MRRICIPCSFFKASESYIEEEVAIHLFGNIFRKNRKLDRKLINLQFLCKKVPIRLEEFANNLNYNVGWNFGTRIRVYILCWRIKTTFKTENWRRNDATTSDDVLNKTFHYLLDY